MKAKITILALVLCLPLFLAAQDNQDSSEVNITDSITPQKGYKSFFGKNSTTYHSMTYVWNFCDKKNIDKKNEENGIAYCMTLARMHVGDTTTVQNKLYRKVTAEYAPPLFYPMPDSLPYYDFSSPIAYIREDTLSGQLYFLESLNEEEYLVCDMSLSIGDTFYSKTEWHDEYVAMVVDSISYSYNHDKTIYFNSNKMVEDIFNLDYAKVPICFMEGIGSCFGPTGYGAYYPIGTFDANWPQIEGYRYILLCTEKDDTVAYMAMEGFGCEPLNLVWGANVEENTALQLQVYPNPASQRVLVEVEGWNGAGTLRLINSVGMVLQTVKMEDAVTELNISKYANGLYTILYTDDKNNRTAVKFVKQE